MKEHINVEKIRVDGGTQLRIRLNNEVSQEYADLMKDGLWDWGRSPLTVVQDGSEHPTFWLVDGFHRLYAAKEAGLTDVPCEVIEGTLQEAIWIASSVNAQHGLRRTNEEKRRAVLSAITHPKALNMSDRKIAEHVGVSHAMVSMIRRQMEGDAEQGQEKTKAPRNRQPVAQGRGSPLKQIERWWSQAPIDDRRALFEHLKMLYEQDFKTA